MSTIERSILALPDVASCVTALVQYVREISGACFEFEEPRWVLRPHNFVTIKVQSARSKDVVFTVRGSPFEFEKYADLELKPDRSGYSRFNFANPGQLHSAVSYIKRAHDIYFRGAGRAYLKPTTIEENL